MATHAGIQVRSRIQNAWISNIHDAQAQPRFCASRKNLGWSALLLGSQAEETPKTIISER
jgi:hypothetical protein